MQTVMLGESSLRSMLQGGRRLDKRTPEVEAISYLRTLTKVRVATEMSERESVNTKCVTVGRTLRGVSIQNAELEAIIILDQGGDILSLTHKRTGVDVLWKVPYSVREPGIGPTPVGDSYAQWLHYYRGGWQTILPNYGPAVDYRGVMLDFHGEAARRPWQVNEGNISKCAIELWTELASLPLRVSRSVSLSSRCAALDIVETVTNLSTLSVDFIWAHHPAFGAPLLSDQSRIYIGARSIQADPTYDCLANDLQLGCVSEWPFALSKSGGVIDLSRVPARGSGVSRVISLTDFEEPWCAVVNPFIPLGVAFSWDRELMPYMCVWQEAGGENGFPHYGRSYTTALEPSSTPYGHGLISAINETRTQLTLSGGESLTQHIKMVLFEDKRAVKRVDDLGEIEFM